MPERRHPFTEDEDAHLVKFIAKNNPDMSGRNGNKLYKTLVENPNRWPWSKTHPWQSWRERYKMNSVWFDRKIKTYLREHKAESAGPKNKASIEADSTNQAEGRTAKRKGPSKAARSDIDERKRTAPVKQQTSTGTSVDGGKPTSDSVKASKVTGSASMDSGYASITKKTPKRLKKNQSELHASGRSSHKTETTSHERSGDNAPVTSSSGYQSTTKPPRPLRQEEDNISLTEKSAEQEERGTPKERTGEDDYVHELFGSFIEDEDEEVTEPEDPPASSAPTSPAPERIYPDVRNVPPPNIVEKQPHVPDPFEFTSSVRPPQDPSPLKTGSIRLTNPHPPPKPICLSVGPPQGEKRLLKRKVPDDPFVDDTPEIEVLVPTLSPAQEQHLATRKGPVLNEVPILQTRNPVENKTETVWPPARKRKESEGPTESHAPTTTAVIGRKTQVKTIASSSEVKLPLLRPDDPFLIRTALQESAQQPVSMPKSATLSKTPIDNGIMTSEAVVTEQRPTKRQKIGHPAVTHQGSFHSTLALVHQSTSATHSNPFASNEIPATRHIDLRESLKKRRLSGKSSHGSIISESNSISNRTTASRRQRVSNDGDLELISLFERDLSELGEQYGFALRVVKQTYLQYGTLEKTVIALRALNAYMKGAQDKLFEEMQRLEDRQDHRDTDEDDLIPEGVIPKSVSSARKGKEKEVVEQESHGASSNKLHRRAATKRGLETSSPQALDPKHERSPTRDEDEFVGLHETEERHEGVDDDDDIGVAIHDRLDVFPDECEIREPTPEVEQADEKELALKAEHKKLCSEVMLENQNILRAFEERQDRDLWEKETGDLITQMFLSLKGAQKIRKQEYYRKKASKTEEGEEQGSVVDESMLF